MFLRVHLNWITYFKRVNSFHYFLSFLLQEPAIAFAKKGYHILLEKPMAVCTYSSTFQSSFINIPKAKKKIGIYIRIILSIRLVTFLCARLFRSFLDHNTINFSSIRAMFKNRNTWPMDVS